MATYPTESPDSLTARAEPAVAPGTSWPMRTTPYEGTPVWASAAAAKVATTKTQLTNAPTNERAVMDVPSSMVRQRQRSNGGRPVQ